MSDRALFLLGNIRPGAFANAALAADAKSEQQFGKGLTDVFVLHSPESAKALYSDASWKNHLNGQGLNTQIFDEFTVGLEEGEPAVARLMRHLHRCLAGLEPDAKIYFDLTNGTSLQKNILSVLAFIVGEGELFAIDVTKLPKSTPTPGFLARAEVLQTYVALSRTSAFDGLARTWLTEVRRFSLRAGHAKQQFQSITRASPSDAEVFKRDLRGAAVSYFTGLQLEDPAFLRGSISGVGRAFESLMAEVTGANHRGGRTPTLDLMIKDLKGVVTNLRDQEDAEKLRRTADLLREIRNQATHRPTPLDFGRISARLAMDLLFAVLDFCEVVFVPDAGRTGYDHFDLGVVSVGSPGVQYYFGVDGDDTGTELESLFQSNCAEEELRAFSLKVNDAIRAVADGAKRGPIDGSIVFCQGDDLLFRGYWDTRAIRGLHEVFSNVSEGRTCSIGFGETVRDTQRALKLAKGSFPKGGTIGFQS